MIDKNQESRIKKVFIKVCRSYNCCLCSEYNNAINSCATWAYYTLQLFVIVTVALRTFYKINRK